MSLDLVQDYGGAGVGNGGRDGTAMPAGFRLRLARSSPLFFLALLIGAIVVGTPTVREKLIANNTRSVQSKAEFCYVQRALVKDVSVDKYPIYKVPS